MGIGRISEKVTAGSAASLIFRFTESSGGRFAGEYPSEELTSGQSYLEGAQAYADSAEFQDVKRMLVSLRDTR